MQLLQCTAVQSRKRKSGRWIVAFRSIGLYAYRYHRAIRVFLPVCSTGIICGSGCTGRFGLYDRAYAEYRSRTDILRWILDFFLFGILQGNEKTSWMRVIPVGIIYFILYYVIFTFLIKNLILRHRDVKTMIQRQSCIQKQMSMQEKKAVKRRCRSSCRSCQCYDYRRSWWKEQYQ